jgi:hypothetical protein
MPCVWAPRTASATPSTTTRETKNQSQPPIAGNLRTDLRHLAHADKPKQRGPDHRAQTGLDPVSNAGRQERESTHTDQMGGRHDNLRRTQHIDRADYTQIQTQHDGIDVAHF